MRRLSLALVLALLVPHVGIAAADPAPAKRSQQTLRGRRLGLVASMMLFPFGLWAISHPEQVASGSTKRPRKSTVPRPARLESRKKPAPVR